MNLHLFAQAQPQNNPAEMVKTIAIFVVFYAIFSSDFLKVFEGPQHPFFPPRILETQLNLLEIIHIRSIYLHDPMAI